MIEWLGTSAFSFLEGVCHPEELILEADRLGYSGLGLADRMGLYGLVQALRTRDKFCQNSGKSFFYAPGIRLHFDSADPLFVYPLHRKAHGDLCRFLSSWALDGMKVREKGLSPLPWALWRDFLQKKSPQTVAEDYALISVSGRFYPWPTGSEKIEDTRLQTQDAKSPTPTFCNPPTSAGQCPFWLLELAEICGRGKNSALSLAYPLTLSPGCEDIQAWLEEHSRLLQIPLLATSLPLFTSKEDQDLCDLVAALRHRVKIADLGYLRQANGERRLLSPFERQFHEDKGKNKFSWDPFERGHELADRHHFSLRELRYHYPKENLPQGQTPSSWLRELTEKGMRQKYPDEVPEEVLKQIEHELELIRQLQYEDYFLTIWDTLHYAREKKILFQGRGSAANSTVCYCLGITAGDPKNINLLFERFMSLERREPPDIDVDFEHERREEVMQEVYQRYGRTKAAMVASVVTFQDRMAVRETAKALGFSGDAITSLIQFMGREGLRRLDRDKPVPELKKRLDEHGILLKGWQRLMDLAPRLVGLPRHVGLHTGGFVLSSDRLDEECILEPARMENRSIIPWDKDDVDELGWMKVDLLSLGMLTVIRKSLEMIGKAEVNLATICEKDDAKVFAAIRRADTVGVFQIESRAQMSMLPRLAPKKFYDLVIEVAIVRPGPIQGGMVHPYLLRRKNPALVQYDHPKLEPILYKTLGIPIFQEQVMRMASEVGGFTPGEADQLRKVMSGAWRSKSSMKLLEEKLYAGMKKHGLTDEYAQRIYRQIEGFGDYGFPESHAASFALLTYASSWLKFYYPAEFLCGLLNSQPMGFYSPAALIADAERHGVQIFPVDILFSQWDSSLEINPLHPSKPFVRLGFHQIKGLSKADLAPLLEAQKEGLLSAEHDDDLSLDKLLFLLKRETIEKLIQAKALRWEKNSPRFNDPRRNQNWQLMSLSHSKKDKAELPLRSLPQESSLEPLTEWEALLADIQSVGLRTQTSAKMEKARFSHVAEFARYEFFPSPLWVNAEKIYHLKNGLHCQVIGVLSAKQRPPTAKGLAFVTLEDESGFMNLVLMPDIYEKYRLVIDTGILIAATALVQKSEPFQAKDPRSSAVSLKVKKIWNPLLNSENLVRFKARDYH